MTQMPALIASLMVVGVLGLTSRDRWQAMQQQHSSTSVMNSKWFIVLMVALLLGSIIALVAVSFVKKYKEMKRQKKEDREQRTEDRKPKMEAVQRAVNAKVVNIAKQAASLITSAGLSRQEVMQLAELIKKEDEKQRTENGQKLVEEKVGAR